MIVPLGLECSIAHYLRANHLREAALPFDWNVTPFTSVMRLLDSRFADFLREEHLVYLPPVQRLLFTEDGMSLVTANEMITPVVCRKHGMLLPHELLRPLDPDLATACGLIRYLSTATVVFAFPRDAVRHNLKGTGFVVPRAEGIVSPSGEGMSITYKR